MTGVAEIYEQAPTTGRPAERLAQQHGFESVAHLAGSLAVGARVLDVGAGASPFGCAVAELRPDITWVNFDYSYHDPAILKDTSRDAPENVQYVAGDAMDLEERYGKEQFDSVFSYWLLGHLSLEELEPAQKVAGAIFAVTKANGLMSVGPKANRLGIPPVRSGKAIQEYKTKTLHKEEYVDKIVAKTRLKGFARRLQHAGNRAAASVFGTSRYAKREGHIFSKIYDPKKDKYIAELTPRGLWLTGKFLATVAGNLINPKK